MNPLSRPTLAALLMAAMSLANADIVVVVAAKSPIGKLSREQVNDIYLNTLKELPNGSQPLPLILRAGPAREEFFDKVLGRSEAQAKAYWARLTFTGKGTAPKEVSDLAELKLLLAANANRIGFMDRSAVDASVKVILAP